MEAKSLDEVILSLKKAKHTIARISFIPYLYEMVGLSFAHIKRIVINISFTFFI